MATFYTGNTGRSRGPHLDFRVWDVEKGSYIDPTPFTKALSSDGKGIDQFTLTSPYGADRGSYTHKGVDYATEIGTPIDVDGQFLGTFNDGGGGITSQYAYVGDDGRAYDLLLMHGREGTETTMGSARTDFDYNSLGMSSSEGLDPDADPLGTRKAAKERAINYSTMSKAEINAAYDQLRRDDPAKARVEGMKMHQAIFGKR